MRNIVSRKGLYVTVAAIVIAIIAAVSVAASGGNASFAERLSQPIFRPLKSAMTAMVGALEHAYDYMYKFDEIQAENERLKEEVAQLREQYREYTEISEENKRLQELLGFSERHQGLEKLPVSVISWNASNFVSSFTISKGSRDGVKLNDPVITSTGYLVGQVTEVSATSAVVTTVVDTRSNVGAMVYESGETGVVQGDYELMTGEQVRLAYMNGENAITIGDTVVTSGSGGVYPRGLVIGTVISMGAGPSGLDEYAIVDVAAEIDKCTHVYVITSFLEGE